MNRSFDIGKTDGANLALRLGDDMGGLQLPQTLGEDFVDAECVFDERSSLKRFDTFVDFAARAGNIEPRPSANRQRGNRSGIVALMRASNQEFLEPERANGFGRGCNQTDDAHGFRANGVHVLETQLQSPDREGGVPRTGVRFLISRAPP